ncbi:TPA: hypothetical protein DEB04_02350 [Candidatus Giovannonibacteria bacterium]|nr:MAG: hypothetical protein A3D61_00175 [Candidatus Giovannonibacteria bacterium RIFCSPHIGHO2_02_FULL_48_15]OGF96086.1 MAG: hypothetical protein A2613_00755 [Candidatus Giovannonibacteria bacterium RIFOXYD1_FULL_48_21]HBT81540.1 hypothetical protein [Candidatus Giovannonibacteria bacterium]
MASSKLKFSLIAVGVLALALAGLSFFVDGPQVTQAPVQSEQTVSQASFEIDFGDGRTEAIEIEVDGTKNLFQVMKEVLTEQEIEFSYESYSGLGELITKIGDKKNGEGGNYWQFWINGNYSMVGASSYIVKPADIIEWKFTDEQQ